MTTSRRFILPLLGAAVALGTAFTSCSSDDSNDYTVEEPKYRIIDFENTGITLAGPTSYGANLYSNYSGTKFINAEIPASPDGVKLQFGIAVSPYTGEPEFYGGGMVLSQWNYRSNPATVTDDESWWKSSQNQCSVYNLASADGTNTGAGGLIDMWGNAGSGSNTFAVINGCDQTKYNPTLSDNCAEINFSKSAELTVHAVQVCPTSYVFGNIAGRNPFGCPTSLKEANGYFCVLAYGYDADGRPTNNGKPATFYFCDYRETSIPNVEYVTGWQTWSLAELGKVNKIRFDFDGSDVGEWGINTPTYACFDNFLIQFKD